MKLEEGIAQHVKNKLAAVKSLRMTIREQQMKADTMECEAFDLENLLDKWKREQTAVSGATAQKILESLQQ